MFLDLIIDIIFYGKRSPKTKTGHTLTTCQNYAESKEPNARKFVSLKRGPLMGVVLGRSGSGALSSDVSLETLH